jgi:hypothetical protein
MAMQTTAGTLPRSSNELDAADKTRSQRRWPPIVFCMAVYLVLAMTVFGHFGSLGPGHMSGGSPDAIFYVWWLAWAAFAIPHGLNVFLASWLNYPFGQNFGVQAGSNLLLGVAFLPITKLFGPIVAWNVAVRLALAASAMSMFLVLRRWCTWWPAAFVGGLLYGFSSYSLWYGRGVYLFLIFVPLPPIIFLVLHEIIVRQRWRPMRAGIVLAVLCTFQFFVSTEILASTLLIGAIATILLIAANRRLLIAHWRYAAAAFGWATLGTVVLLTFPLLYTFTGPEHINGQLFAPTKVAAADLLSPVVPNVQWIDPKVVPLASSNSFQDSLIFGGDLYLGLPLIIALICFAVFLRNRRAILFTGSMVLICFVLSLGNPLWADGHRTQIPLPFVVLQHLPIIQEIEADRLSLFTSLFAAGMFAIGLDEIWVQLGRWRLRRLSPTRTKLIGGLSVALLVGIVILALVPDGTIATSVTGPPDVPSFFSTKAIDTVPAGSVALTYPYEDSESTGAISFFSPLQSAMLNQAVSGMRFKLIGGAGYFPSPSDHYSTGPAVLAPKSVQALFDVAFMGGTPEERALLATSSVPADLRRFLRKYDVMTVIIDPLGDWKMVVGQVSAALGSPSHIGGVVLWSHVQERLRNGPAS